MDSHSSHCHSQIVVDGAQEEIYVLWVTHIGPIAVNSTTGPVHGVSKLHSASVLQPTVKVTASTEDAHASQLGKAARCCRIEAGLEWWKVIAAVVDLFML
jgi:hypothetical protein